jgi:hypothetical protein
LSIFAQLSNQAKVLQPKFTIYNGDADFWPTDWLAALNGNNNNGMSNITFAVRGNGDDNTEHANWPTFYNFRTVANTIGATNYVDALIPQANETYSFDYGNSRFLGIDVPDCANIITQSEINWAAGRITDAESRGLTHVFMFMHGPIWYADDHTDCTMPAGLVNLISAHSIVTATFHGHEHIKSVAFFGPTDNRLTMAHNYVQVISGGAGGDSYPCNASRLRTGDYCGEYEGFANVTVEGSTVTIAFYEVGITAPVKTITFTRSTSAFRLKESRVNTRR